MSYAVSKSVTITTNSDGDATGDIANVTGRIISITYTKVDYADGVDFVITVEATGEAVWSQINVNATATVAPRQATHSTAGVASLYSTSNSEPVEDYIVLANSRIKIVIDEGGSVTSGTFTVIMG